MEFVGYSSSWNNDSANSSREVQSDGGLLAGQVSRSGESLHTIRSTHMASLVQPSRYWKILAALLVVPFAALFAQEMQEGDSTNTIEKEILAHRETDISVLGKTRAVLVEAIQSGDTTKVRKVLTYIERRFDPAKVTVLYPQEEILIAYWLRDYETALSFIAEEEVEDEGNREKLYPERDLMFERIAGGIRERRVAVDCRAERVRSCAIQEAIPGAIVHVGHRSCRGFRRRARSIPKLNERIGGRISPGVPRIGIQSIHQGALAFCGNQVQLGFRL